ncbi:MAG: hypothetical protein ACAH59_14190 [Pseudobdellovibrionaceae bacterium]
MKPSKGQRFHCWSVFLLLFLVGCSSKSARSTIEETQDRARPRAAAYAADGFMMDHRSPEGRAYRPWQFYYKHCTLVSRNPYPDRAEHSCTTPY